MVVRIGAYKVGMEVDAKCPPSCKNRAKLGEIQSHIIIAMVGEKIARVQCKQCESEHGYKAPPSASEATAKKRRAERKAATMDLTPTITTSEEYDRLIKGREVDKPTAYSVKMPTLVRDMVVKHSQFGLGIVTDIREGNKAHVAFPDGGRVLVYGR